MRIGLTLGKFAPFHKGHQYMIEQALAQVDRLYVLVYEADETWMPLTCRARWIRTLYPEVVVIEGHNAPQSQGYSANIIAEQDAYIKSMMPEPITHFFSSEPYGTHVSKALNALDVRIDMSRAAVPLSATIVRANPADAHKYLHPIVLKDFCQRIVVLGAESTGKTTLTATLAERYRTTCMLEHGREFWIRHNVGGKLTPDQLVELAHEHRTLERRAFAASNGLFFTDTNAFTTLEFCRLYGDEPPEALVQMAEQDFARYDRYLVCDTDIPFVQDGTRQNEDVRKVMQDNVIGALNDRGIRHDLISGPLDQRLDAVRNLLECAR